MAIRPQSSPASARARRPALRRLLAVFAVFSALSASAGPGDAPPADARAFSRLYFGLQPVADRPAERRVELVEELLDAGRFSEAAPLVGKLLGGDRDALDANGLSIRQRTLAAVVAADGAAAPIRTVLAGAQRRALQQASTPAELRAIIAAYPPELFGVAALRRLAALEADRARYGTAAAALELAAEVLRGHHRGDAAEEIEEVEEARRAHLVRAGVDSASDAGAPSELADAARRNEQRRAPWSWIAAAGDPRRMSIAPGGVPSPWRRWRAVIGDEPAPTDPPSEEGDSTPGDAVAFGDVVVARGARGLVALDAASGRKRWTVPFPPGTSEWRGQSDTLGVTTDTRLVFAVTPTRNPAPDSQQRLSRRFGDSLFRGDRGESAPNRLAAFEASTAGKLAWELDGGDEQGPIAGARFLGPPAPRDGLLYTVVEQEQALRLLEIEAETGAVLWSQPLVESEREPTPYAASIAEAPTLGERGVYCLTGRGAVAAIDPLRRTLLWVRCLDVDESRARPATQGGWGALREPPSGRDAAAGWRHCRALLVGDLLVAASPALGSLQAFERTTGALRWRRDLADARFLAWAGDDAVVTLHDSSVVLRSAADGVELSRAELPTGDGPVGEGLLVGSDRVVPLESGKVAVIGFGVPSESLAAVEVVDFAGGPLDAPSRLGTLLWRGDAVYSVSASTVECFRQRGADPDPIDAAASAVAAGNSERAIELLAEQLERPEATDFGVREAYAASLLAGVWADDARTADAARLLPGLAAGPAAKAHAAALRIAAAATRGDSSESIAEAEELAADPIAAEVILEPESSWQVAARRFAAERARRVGAGPAVVARVAAAASDESDLPEETPPPTGLWSRRQIASEVAEIRPDSTLGGRTSRGQTSSSAKVRQVPLDAASRRHATLHWTVESRAGGGEWMLVASNSRGERFGAATLSADPWIGSAAGEADSASAGCRAWADWLALRQEGECVVAHASRGLVWESGGVVSRGWPAIDCRLEGPETPQAIGPWGVVTLAGDLLRCRDLVTGVVVWRRALPPADDATRRLLSAGDTLYVVIAERSGMRVSAWSGEQVGPPWRPSDPRTWRATVGDRLFTESRSPRERRFSVESLTGEEGDAPLWTRVVPTNAVWRRSGSLAAFLTADQQLAVVDIERGAERFATRLPATAEHPVRALRLRERDGRLLVEVDRSNPVVDRMRGVSAPGDEPLLSGELYCLDASTGEALWGAPVEVDALAVVDSAAYSAPVVLLARRQAAPSSDERGEARYTLVVLDLTTGATLYRNHNLPAGDEHDGPAPLGAYRESLGSGPDAAERLLVRIGRSWVTLETTAAPAPPRPVSVARVEDPEVARPGDAKDLGDGVERLFNSFWEGDDD